MGQRRRDKQDLAKAPEASKRDELIAAWGRNIAALGLVGLLLPSMGLQLARLRELGDSQWIVYACVTVVGTSAFVWGNRHRPGYAWPVAVGALLLVPALSYLSFWRHARLPEPINPAATHRELTSRAGPPRPNADGSIGRLHIEFEGTFDKDEFALLSEFVRDAVPTATSFQAHHRSSSNVATVAIGPIPQGIDVLKLIPFGTASMVNFDRMRVQVKRPFPPASESIRNRVELALQGLRSGDVSQQQMAVITLTALEPLARRDEVANELFALLSQPNPPVSAAEPLKKWATPAQVEGLKALVGKEGINPAPVVEVLAAISPGDVVPIAIELIPKDRGLAKYALERAGAPAEKAILASLDNPDPVVRATCCEILLQIGTEASLAPLVALQDDQDPTTATAARRAREVIAGRVKK